MTSKRKALDSDSESEFEEEDSHIPRVSCLIKNQKLESKARVEIDQYDNENEERARYEELAPEFWWRIDAPVLLTLIFSHLNVISLSCCAVVSKLWNKNANHPYVWNILFENTFGRPLRSKNDKTKDFDWKKEFQQEFQNYREVSMDGANLGRSRVIVSRSFAILQERKPFVVPQICKLYSFGDLQRNICIVGNAAIGTQDGNIYAYDLERSEMKWKKSVESAHGIRTIVADKDSLFLLRKDGTVFARNLAAGFSLWKYQKVKIRDILIHKNELLCLDEGGSLRSIDTSQGTENWVINISKGVYCTSTLVRDNKCYWVTQHVHNLCSLYVLQVACVEFHHILLSIDITKYLLTVTNPSMQFHVMGDVAFVYSSSSKNSGQLVALQMDYEEESVSQLWIIGDAERFTDPCCHRGAVWMLNTEKACMIALNAFSGQQIHSISLEESFKNSEYPIHLLTTVHNARTYILDDVLWYYIFNSASEEWILGAIDTRNGALLWKSNTLVQHSSMLTHGFAYHPNIKAILGTSFLGSSVFMLWHGDKPTEQLLKMQVKNFIE